MEFLGKTEEQLNTDYPERSYLFRIVAATESETANRNLRFDLELFLPQIQAKIFTKIILSDKNFTHKKMSDFCKSIGHPEWYVNGGNCKINAYDLIELFGYADFKYEAAWNSELQALDPTKKRLQPANWLPPTAMEAPSEPPAFPTDEVFRDDNIEF